MCQISHRLGSSVTGVDVGRGRPGVVEESLETSLRTLDSGWTPVKRDRGVFLLIVVQDGGTVETLNHRLVTRYRPESFSRPRVGIPIVDERYRRLGCNKP